MASPEVQRTRHLPLSRSREVPAALEVQLKCPIEVLRQQQLLLLLERCLARD